MQFQSQGLEVLVWCQLARFQKIGVPQTAMSSGLLEISMLQRIQDIGEQASGVVERNESKANCSQPRRYSMVPCHHIYL
jgi:hypothetical protein